MAQLHQLQLDPSTCVVVKQCEKWYNRRIGKIQEFALQCSLLYVSCWYGTHLPKPQQCSQDLGHTPCKAMTWRILVSCPQLLHLTTRAGGYYLLFLKNYYWNVTNVTDKSTQTHVHKTQKNTQITISSLVCSLCPSLVKCTLGIVGGIAMLYSL